MKRLDNGENGDNPTKNEKTSNLEDKSTEEENKMNCVICFEMLEENDIFQWPFCAHKFHKECANEWMKISQTCPLCRTHNGEKPRGIDLSEFGELHVLLIDPESIRIMEENMEVRERILDAVRSIINANRGQTVGGLCFIIHGANNLFSTDQNASQPTKDELHFPPSNYNEPESNLRPCGTQIPEPGRSNLKNEERNKPLDNSILNHSNYINELPVQSRNYRAFQDGNDCLRCLKKLPFNEQTLGRDELCDECKKSGGMDGKKNKENEIANFLGNNNDNKNIESFFDNNKNNNSNKSLFGNDKNAFGSSNNQCGFSMGRDRNALKRLIVSEQQVRNRMINNDRSVGLFGDEGLQNDCFSEPQDKGGLLKNVDKSGNKDNEETSHQNPTPSPTDVPNEPVADAHKNDCSKNVCSIL